MPWIKIDQDKLDLPKKSGWYPVIDEKRHVFAAFFDVSSFRNAITWEASTKIMEEFVSDPVAWWEESKAIEKFDQSIFY